MVRGEGWREYDNLFEDAIREIILIKADSSKKEEWKGRGSWILQAIKQSSNINLWKISKNQVRKRLTEETYSLTWERS